MASVEAEAGWASLLDALAGGRRLARPRQLDERGATAVMTALLAVPLIGVCALAVDVGIWQMNKSAMQGAADQALLAAGLAKAAGGSAENEAKGIAAAHGFVHDTSVPPKTTVTVGVPTTGSYAGNANALEVVITQPQQTFLSSVIAGFSAPVASARAVGVDNPKTKVCALALIPSDAAFLAGGGISQLNGCGLAINSTAACAVSLNGASTKLIASDISLVGTAACTSSSATISGTQRTKSAPVPDPYSFRAIPVPTPGCPNPDKNINEGSGTKTIGPGTYCGIILGLTAKLILKPPGVYIIDGGSINLGGSSEITGENVSLILTSSSESYGSIMLSQDSKITITARNSADSTAGIGIWLDKRGGTGVSLGGNSKISVAGAIYVPNGPIIFGNSSQISATTCGQLIAKNFSFSNSTALTIAHNCDGYGIVTAFSGGGGMALKE